MFLRSNQEEMVTDTINITISLSVYEMKEACVAMVENDVDM
jgi:hypothetical protein